MIATELFKCQQNNYNSKLTIIMFFMCKDVTVNNYEYYYNCNAPQPRPSINKTKHSKPPRISLTSSNQHSQYKEHQSTLLQRIRRKNESLETTLYATKINRTEARQNMKKQEDSEVLPLIKKQTKLNKTSSDQNNKSEYTDSNFSFCLPKQILISHTYHDLLEELGGENFIIQQQSSLMQPTISGKFLNVKCTVSNENICEHIAVDLSIGVMVSLKAVSGNSQLVFKQIQTYNKISPSQYILQLYQVCLHQGNLVLIKEPYTKTRPAFEDKQSIFKDIGCALKYLESNQMFMGKLSIDDIRECYGIWKLCNFINFFPSQQIPIKDNLLQLLSQIL